MIEFLNYSRNNSVILYGRGEILLFSIICQEKFLDPMVNIFSRKYTNRCAMLRTTTFPKFRRESVTLIVHSRITLKFDDQNCILVFKFESFVSENGFQKILEIGHFVEKKNSLSFEMFRTTNPTNYERENRKIRPKLKKSIFRTCVGNLKKYGQFHFLKDQSE